MPAPTFWPAPVTRATRPSRLNTFTPFTPGQSSDRFWSQIGSGSQGPSGDRILAEPSDSGGRDGDGACPHGHRPGDSRCVDPRQAKSDSFGKLRASLNLKSEFQQEPFLPDPGGQMDSTGSVRSRSGAAGG